MVEASQCEGCGRSLTREDGLLGATLCAACTESRVRCRECGRPLSKDETAFGIKTCAACAEGRPDPKDGQEDRAGLLEYVAKKLVRGRDKSAIVQELTQVGWPEEWTSQYVDETEMKVKKGLRTAEMEDYRGQVFAGLIILVGVPVLFVLVAAVSAAVFGGIGLVWVGGLFVFVSAALMVFRGLLGLGRLRVWEPLRVWVIGRVQRSRRSR